MKEFDEWFINHPRNSGNDKRFRNKEGMEMAFKAGMLAAADIAHLASEESMCQRAAEEIRRKATNVTY